MKRTTCWLASYPKSGNTWLRLLWEAVHADGALDINELGTSGPSAADRMAFETALGISSGDLYPEDIELLRASADRVISAGQTRVTPRKVHDALLPGPTGEPLVSLDSAVGAIYVVRDPRDVAVSLSHYLGQPVAEAVEIMVSEDAVIGFPQIHRSLLLQYLSRWDDHVRSWVDTDLMDVHLLRYEDCLRDPLPTFDAALRSVGLIVEPARLEAAVAATSFSRLSAQETESGFREASRSGIPFFRSGQAGGWSAELPEPLARTIEHHFGPTMERFGYL